MLIQAVLLTLTIAHVTPDVTQSNDLTRQPDDTTRQPDDATRHSDVKKRPDDATRQQQLKALEQVKDELYQQLQSAVDDTVQELNHSGDAAGLLQIRELQARLNDGAPQRGGSVPARRQLDQDASPAENAASEERPVPDGPAPDGPPGPDGPAPDGPVGPMMVPTSPSVDKNYDRRAQGVQEAKYWYDFFNMGDALKLQYDNDGFIPSKSKMKKKEKGENEKQEINKKLMVERLKQWIVQKQEEKRKIREWRVHYQAESERCPRFGKRKKKTYPCCRKCCKSSYLGCL